MVIMDGDGGWADMFAMGAGHVNPARAVDLAVRS
jgi:hypothetical protein